MGGCAFALTPLEPNWSIGTRISTRRLMMKSSRNHRRCHKEDSSTNLLQEIREDLNSIKIEQLKGSYDITSIKDKLTRVSDELTKVGVEQVKQGVELTKVTGASEAG